jgi:hypothetical protein
MARTHLVRIFAATYTAGSIVFLVIGVKLGGSRTLTPLLIAAPLILLQLNFDFTRRSRALIAELAGSVATGSLATSLALSAGWPLRTALVLWVIVIGRSAPTILYLRTQLRRLHGRRASAGPPLLAHVAAIVVMLFLIRIGAAPVLALVAVLILFVRALVGLSNADRGTTAKTLGLHEMLFGAIALFTVASGYLLHL